MRLIRHGGSVLRARCSFFSLVNDDHEALRFGGVPLGYRGPSPIQARSHKEKLPRLITSAILHLLRFSDAKSPEETK